MASCDVRHSYRRREASLLLHLRMQYFFYEENLQAYLDQMMATQPGGWWLGIGTVMHSNSFPLPAFPIVFISSAEMCLAVFLLSLLHVSSHAEDWLFPSSFRGSPSTFLLCRHYSLGWGMTNCDIIALVSCTFLSVS